MNDLTRLILLYLAFGVFGITARADNPFEIEKIVGKTQKQVFLMLGKSSGEEKTKYGPKLSYRDNQIEIVFIHDKADWITINPPTDVVFGRSAITALGLKDMPPTFENSEVIRWEPHGTFHSISIFNSEGKVWYAYIKAFTP
jgi:hypothetical protein